MKKKKLLVAAFSAFLCLGGPMRAEQVYVIYPVPQQQVSVAGTVSFTPQVNVICEPGIDDVTRNRVADILSDNGLEVVFGDQAQTGCSNIYIGINGSAGVADNLGNELGIARTVFTQEGKFDRHSLSLVEKDGQACVLVLGENTDAAFFGLASLEQILEQGKTDLPCVNIYDYADQQSRGLVEGYYGYPYTVAVKKDLMKFMMRHKMNTYMYGAKSDPYHSQYWKQAYPTSLTAEQEKNGWLSQDMVKDIATTSQATKVNFIWAIHPGNDFTGSSTVINDIMGKFDKMYNLGVRQFAVFVDDVDVPTDAATHTLNANRLTQLQQAIEAKYNVEGAASADTVKPIHFVPQVYASSSVDASVRKSFFNALASTPKNVVIYTTGWGVWSVPNSSDLLVVKEDLGRDVAWWWNYPCNDDADGQLYTMDMYSNFYDMPRVSNTATMPSSLEHGLGIVSNPMQEGEVAKIPLFSVADYAWNNAAFNNAASWDASFSSIVDGDNVAAFKLLAKYLRYNDPEELNTLISSYKATLSVGNPNPTKLKEKMTEVLDACNQLVTLKDSEKESDRLLYSDLSPWLLKLRQMASSVCALLDAASLQDDEAAQWSTYVPQVKLVDELSTAEEYKAYALEGMGNWISVSERPSQPSELYLYPFVNYLKENALGNLFAGNTVKDAPKLITNKETTSALGVCQKDNSGIVNLYVPKVALLEKGKYIGISLPQAMKISDVAIQDTLLANYSVLYSENGKIWKSFTAVDEQPDGFVRYVCVQNDSETPRPIRFLKNTIKFTTPTLPVISSTTGPSGSVWEDNSIGNMTDRDYTTYYILKRNQINGDAYTLTLKTAVPITDVRICMGTTNDDYMTMGRVQVSEDGVNWKNLRVKGATRTDFTMSLPQVVKYSDEMSYCDFAGDNTVAKYVRLYVETANTSKWLRLAEIEVNRLGYQEQLQPICTDANGSKVTETTDGKAYTALTEDTENYIVYNLQKIGLLKSLVVYQDVTGGQAQMQVSLDGENWEDLATLSENRMVVDMSACSNAVAVKIAWTDNVPLIYEIVEVTEESNAPLATGIGKVLSSDDSKVQVTFSGKSVIAASGEGISGISLYGADGREYISSHFSGNDRVSLPLVGVPSGVALLKVTLSTGQQVSYKLLLK